MSIRKHIEHADDALRLAIIEALEKKQDEQLQTLFEALSKVKELILTTPIRGVDNVTSYYRNNAEYNFKLDSDALNTNDPIGYSLNTDLIEGIDISKYQRHGKDLDKLDGPS
tara:strand:+ start:180 stop:515 length:336 start_codon:yes stop_codon:yes gene_type:complete